VFDSLLSEYAALGFEYGYSHANPNALVMWEAQFGDFINGAQIVIDQYIVAAEDKWGQRNGVVLLLPHGYEGQGPEHSSARIERFMILAAEDNMQLVNTTTAANYFHLLRRQVNSERRTPLIVFTPKQGLRMKQTRSPVDALTQGSFEEVLDDPGDIDANAVSRIVFCSGKVAWDAIDERDRRSAPRSQWCESSSSIRCPSSRCRGSCGGIRTLVSWSGCRRSPRTWAPGDSSRATPGASRSRATTCATSRESSPAVPATGSKAIHDQELADLMERTFRNL
jgi:multifunctional 2-oxoglutarate metabolism enzyme